jgi:predicted ribonuclease YlaK
MDNLVDGNATIMMQDWIDAELVEFDSPYFAKGRSFGNASTEYRILVDEAEDLTTKTVKLLGTRLGDNAKIIFCGDYNQAEKEYLDQNGLLHLIESSKDAGLVGFVNLEKDVRSEASKWFAEMY